MARKSLRFTWLFLLAISVAAFGTTQPSTSNQPDSSSAQKSAKVNKGKTAKHAKAKPAARKEHESKTAREADLPPALARHLEKRFETIPGNGGESANGPGGAADQAFMNRAFPDTDIPVERINTARAAFSAIKSKGFPKGKGQPGTWVTIGPSNAIYPLTDLRTGYVPAEYAAGGRTTGLVIGSNCAPGHCTLWASPAGGGVWRTKNALDGQPSWQYLSGSFGINAIGSIVRDANDASDNTIWAGTGEANACGSGCEAGVGIYKSSDGGDTWSGPLGQSAFNARAVGTMAIKPGDSNTIYAGSTRGLRGASSVCCGGAVTLIPGAPKWGLYKSTDGGTSWTYIFNGAATVAGCTGDVFEASNLTPCSPRGVRRVVVDPFDANTIYAGAYARGVWRSNDGGATWTQIKASLNSADTTMRPELTVAALPNGKTRMYVAEGSTGAPYSRLFRSDDVASGAPVFTDMTSANPADPGYGSFNYCTGQCWYDNYVYSPPGNPDMVYLVGSYQYGEVHGISNGRAVTLSTDAGVSFTDMTMDSTDPIHANGLHPDEHFIVVNPNNPNQFWESSDGGIMRSSGSFADVSGNCTPRGLSAVALARCQQLLSRVPTQLQSMNKGLSTLQFQSLSVSPFNTNIVQGGTQDNGTWQTTGNPNKWINTIFGDGGQSGFDVGNPHFRFHTFFAPQPDVNFSDGDTIDWNWIGDPIVGDPSQFYIPILTDPKVSGTMFAGTVWAYRTKTNGVGAQSIDSFRSHCNEFFGDFTVICGDWARMGPSTLTSAVFGTRAGGNVAALSRSTGDSNTLWAATTTGRVFVSKNGDADPASSVVFHRIDQTAANSPGRFISGIAIDPANTNHAFISYDGFSASTPATPGHVFEVTYDPITNTATFVDRSGNLDDTPITGIAFDNVTGDVYASSDFGVVRLASGSATWTLAAPGMPNVEVAGLTIVPGARKLFAASHGLGAWLLNLP